MNEAQELIANVYKIGGKVDLRGEKIHFRLPRTLAASQLLEELRSRRPEVIAALRNRPQLAACGMSHCAGCYDVGNGRKIHPPKCGKEHRAWLERWKPMGKPQ